MIDSLDIFAERQFQHDGDRRQEFAQHPPDRVNSDISGRIRAKLGSNPQRLGARKSCC